MPNNLIKLVNEFYQSTQAIVVIPKPYDWFNSNITKVLDELTLSEQYDEGQKAPTLIFLHCLEEYLKSTQKDKLYYFKILIIKQRKYQLALELNNFKEPIELDQQKFPNIIHIYPDLCVLDWLKICYRSNSDPDIRFFFKSKKIDAEKECKNILFEKEENLRAIFKEEWKIYIEDIISWFTTRFDFHTVKEIINARKKESFKWINFYNFFLMLIPLLMIIISLKIRNIQISFVDYLNWLPFTFNNGVYKLTTKKGEEIITAVYNSPEVFFEILFILFIIYCIYKIWKNPLYINLLSPRLLIGIFVGYISLLSGSTFWNLSIYSFSSENHLAVIITAIILLALNYFYIRYEVSKAIGKENKSLITERTLAFFRKCVWSSFFLGLLLIDLFFILYLRYVSDAMPLEKLSYRFHTGVLGIIDPVILMFFFPMALIIGVVIKFLLDEKPITHPLKG